MQKRHMLFALVGALLLAGIPLTVLAASRTTAGTPAVANGPAVPLPSGVPDPIYFATGGPFIGEAKALSLATDLAKGAVLRQEVHVMAYSAISEYLGSRNHYYDLNREMYLVVTSAPYRTRGGAMNAPVTCGSYVTVIDATTGTLLASGCRGIGPWPDNVPAPFQN